MPEPLLDLGNVGVMLQRGGGGLCLMLVIMGPSPQFLTYAFLLGIMALCSPFLLYDGGYLGEFQQGQRSVSISNHQETFAEFS